MPSTTRIATCCSTGRALMPDRRAAPRHLLEIAGLSGLELEELFAMADEGPQPHCLVDVTFMAAFFQESTRTRLGFMSAAARQGARLIDMGGPASLRREPPEDQQMVIAEAADVVAVRHWDPRYAADLARRGRCSVVNAGAGATSHPTQALIDAYTLRRTLGEDLTGLRVLFLGDTLLRSAESFRELASTLGVMVSHRAVAVESSVNGIPHWDEELGKADVVYVQSLSGTDYLTARLNVGDRGPALPPAVTGAVSRSDALIMHALPRGPELSDELMRDRRCLVSKQVEHGLPVRSAVLRWLTTKG